MTSTMTYNTHIRNALHTAFETVLVKTTLVAGFRNKGQGGSTSFTTCSFIQAGVVGNWCNIPALNGKYI